MDENTAISVRGLGKRFYRGQIGVASLREEMEALWARLNGRVPKVSPDLFHALRDVSFDVPAGKVCGIIGRNGSGKTTLLKVLSSITAPDEGEAILRGRVGSLLEVGAGFHPDLDGIENIYLNGAVLGMSHAEIRRKLPEIIAFAGIDAFLKTPVKRYSSGMYVRLAFSVAAHLEPEILIIDEVLAVGDAEFQRRCLGKMKRVASEGRTVLFVSHNLAMVRQLCDVVVHLDGGRVQRIGPPAPVIQSYLASTVPVAQGAARRASENCALEVSLLDSHAGTAVTQAVFGSDYTLLVRVHARLGLDRALLRLWISDQEGTLLSTIDTTAEGIDLFEINPGDSVEMRFDLSQLALLPGSYSIGTELRAFGEEEPEIATDDLMSLEIVPAVVNSAALPYDRHHGIVRLVRAASFKHV